MASRPLLVASLFLIVWILPGHRWSTAAGAPGPQTMTFGSVDTRRADPLPGGRIYLTHEIQQDGVLYKVEAHFRTTDLVFIQIWSEESNDMFELVYQKGVRSDRPNQTKEIFLSNSVNLCPLVEKGMMLGVWSPAEHLPISSYEDTMTLTGTLTGILTSPYSSKAPPPKWQYFQFSENVWRQFSIKGYLLVIPDAARRKRSPSVGECPTDVSTVATHATVPFTVKTMPKMTTTPTVSVHEIFTTEEDVEPEGDIPNDKFINKRLLYILLGVVIGAVLLIVLAVVCCVTRRRKQPNIAELAASGKDQKPAGKVNEGMAPDVPRRPSPYERTAFSDNEPPAHDYTTLSVPPLGGVYEEIEEAVGAKRQHPDKETPPPDDGAYLKPAAGAHLANRPTYEKLKAGKQQENHKSDTYLELIDR